MFDYCWFCVVIRFFIPATTSNDLQLRRIFYPRFYPLRLFSYLHSWEGASIFPFECSVLNKGTTGTIFITSLLWRRPWLRIEPGLTGLNPVSLNSQFSGKWTNWKWLNNDTIGNKLLIAVHLPSGEKKDTLDTKYASSASNYKLFYTWKSCAVHKCFKECCYCF